MIKNRSALARFHGNAALLALSALEQAICSVQPAVLVRQAVRPSGSRILVRDIYGKTVRLENFDNIYVVGAGKAAGGMADALCSVLKDSVTGGAVTVPYGTRVKNKIVSVTEASHPIPDGSGVDGTKKILDVLKSAKQNDLLFILISGGGSALMPLPIAGVSLADKQRITSLLLHSGASIQEINTVRKHLSAVKGGHLLRHTGNSCTVVSLILSDVTGDDLGAVASGPTYPDSSTFSDALAFLKKYRIARDSEPVTGYLAKGIKGMVSETPKPGDHIFDNVHNILVGNNTVACESAAGYLKRRGLQTVNLGSRFDGEAADFGRLLARLAGDLGRAPTSFAIVAGGETTVRPSGSKAGMGGRNQEAALSCAINLRPGLGVAVACMGTDGIDGNSDAAGAIVSQKTNSLARKKRLDMKRYLASHDSYHALEKLNSLVFTGQTGTNVNDIAIICKPST